MRGYNYLHEATACQRGSVVNHTTTFSIYTGTCLKLHMSLNTFMMLVCRVLFKLMFFDPEKYYITEGIFKLWSASILLACVEHEIEES